MGGAIRIGRIAGIPIGIHPLWVLIVALIAWSLGEAYYPEVVDGISPAAAYGLGLISALLLFASILLHELGHALVARRHGVEVEEIDLWLLGGVARMDGTPDDPGAELRYALAGPAVTLAIALFFGALAGLMPDSAPEAVAALVGYQAFVNVAILVFNLLPAFPLDGGRVLRALLWQRDGDVVRATGAAVTVGRLFAYGFIALGLLSAFGGAPGGLWLIIIGLFVMFAGRGEEESLRVRALLGDLPLRRLAVFPAVTIGAEIGLEQALTDYFVRFGYRSFPVVEQGTPVGLLTIESVEALPSSVRAQRTAGETALRDPGLFIDEDVEIEELVSRPAFARHGRVVVIGAHGEVGLLSVTTLNRALRARTLVRRSGSGTATAPVRT